MSESKTLMPTGGSSGVVLVITDWRAMEDALCACQERLAAAQEAGRVGVFDWDLVFEERFPRAR